MKKRTLKSALLLAMVLVMVISMLGCAQNAPAQESEATTAAANTAESSAAAPSGKDPKQVRILLNSFDSSQFPNLQYNGVKDACAEVGATPVFQSPDHYPDLKTQVEIIESAIADGVDAILVHPVDSKGIVPTLKKAMDAGVAIFIVDTEVADPSVRLGFYGSNNKNLGVVAAENLGKLMNGEGEVAVLAGNEGSSAHTMRRDGFLETMKTKYPNVKVVDVQYDKVDALTATQMTSAFMTAHPNLKAMFATGQTGYAGMIAAITEAKASGKYILTGIDSGKVINGAIKDGTVNGSVMQSPYMMGYLAAKAAIEYATTGKKPAQEINDTGSIWVDKSNVDSADAKKVEYD